MSTVLQMVRRAMRLATVIDARDSPSAEETSDAIAALNAMVTRWEANGLALGWANVDSSTDTLPVPLEAEEALANNLACKLASEYGKAAPQQVQQDARDGLAELRRDRLVSAPLTLVSDLPRSHGLWNITTDEPV
jgi:hypothetical protein